MNRVLITIDATDFEPPECWQLIDWCKARGADEFSITCLVTDDVPSADIDEFDRACSPHALASQMRERLTHRQGEEWIRPTDLWILNDVTLAALKSGMPFGLWQMAGAVASLEDLTLYREGLLMLGVISHEGYGRLQLSDVELDEFHRLGFVGGVANE